MKALLLDSFVFGYIFFVSLVAVTNPGEDALIGNVYSYLMYFAILFVVGGALSKLLNSKNIKTLGEAIFEAPHKKHKSVPKPWVKTFWGLQLIVAFVYTLVVGTILTEFSLAELLDEDGMGGARNIFYSLLTPNFEIMPQALLAIVETIYIAFMATIIAIPAAFLLAFLCAKNIMGNTKIGFTIYMFLRTLLNVTRSIEPLIWAIIFSVWVGIGPFAGMLALMLHSIASLTKQYSEIIESVNEGPIEGIQATGGNFIQVLWFAIVPQIILPYISFTIYRWDINVRMATIIGLVGGGGIGTMLMQYQGQALWHEVGALALLIVIVVWSMDTASAYIREAIK
jgi:phosphonate transport system permease protein